MDEVLAAEILVERVGERVEIVRVERMELALEHVPRVVHGRKGIGG
jgi:hypothetical protein